MARKYSERNWMDFKRHFQLKRHVPNTLYSNGGLMLKRNCGWEKPNTIIGTQVNKHLWLIGSPFFHWIIMDKQISKKRGNDA